MTLFHTLRVLKVKLWTQSGFVMVNHMPNSGCRWYYHVMYTLVSFETNLGKHRKTSSRKLLYTFMLTLIGWALPHCWAWWRHITETLSTVLALCVGNPPLDPSYKGPTMQPVMSCILHNKRSWYGHQSVSVSFKSSWHHVSADNIYYP